MTARAAGLQAPGQPGPALGLARSVVEIPLHAGAEESL